MYTSLFLVVCSLVIRKSFSQGICSCVSRNTCYQNVTYDGAGVIDIRIATTVESTTILPPVPTTIPGVCPAGYDLCCTGPTVTGCGLRYYVPIVPAISPNPGQSRYGSQPWQAVILGTDGSYLGGGALIDQNNVVTAAHKIFGKTAGTIKVRMGEWNASTTTEPYPIQESVVSAINIHPGYNNAAGNLFNDIAVLKLATPINVDISPAIDTICLPSASSPSTLFDNMRCLVAGWGKDAFTGSPQNVQKETEVPVVTYDTCQTRLRTTKLGPMFSLDPGSFICAGGESGKDACTGDGGSALSCIVAGRYFLVGLVAWGVGCGDSSIPGVYVRVQSYINWINSVK